MANCWLHTAKSETEQTKNKPKNLEVKEINRNNDYQNNLMLIMAPTKDEEYLQNLEQSKENFLKKVKKNDLDEVEQLIEDKFKENNHLSNKYQELLTKIGAVEIVEDYNLQDFKNWLLAKPDRKGLFNGKIISKSYYNKMLRKRIWQEFLKDDQKRELEKGKLKSLNRLKLLKMVEVFEDWINNLH